MADSFSIDDVPLDLTGKTMTVKLDGVDVCPCADVSVSVTTIQPPPAPVGPPVWSRTLVDVGMNAQIAAWRAAMYTWFWELKPFDPLGTGKPGLLINSHADSGTKYFERDSGSLTFSEKSMGPSYLTFPVVGEGMTFDIDGDGRLDYGTLFDATPAKPLYLQNADGTFTAQTGNTYGGYRSYITRLYSDEATGRIGTEINPWTPYVSAPYATFDGLQTKRQLWNGSSLVTSWVPLTFPAGIPASVMDEIRTRTVIANASGPAYSGAHVHQIFMDLDNDGVQDLVVAGYFSYGTDNFGFYLRNNGDGTYSDMTAAWGLPRMGTFIPVQPYWRSSWPRWIDGHDALQRVDATSNPSLFIAHKTNEVGGHFTWDGSTYVRRSSPISNNYLAYTLRANDTLDEYMPQLFSVDLRNQTTGSDLILIQPRFGQVSIYLNDGSGNFIREGGNFQKVFATYGFCAEDWNETGRLSIMLMNQLAGTTPTHGVTLLRNDTQNIGNWLKIRLRRSSGFNRFGALATVSIYRHGTITLLKRLPANPSGIPLHFGCGYERTVDVVVEWPDGTLTSVDDVYVNQTITVGE